MVQQVNWEYQKHENKKHEDSVGELGDSRGCVVQLVLVFVFGGEAWHDDIWAVDFGLFASFLREELDNIIFYRGMCGQFWKVPLSAWNLLWSETPSQRDYSDTASGNLPPYRQAIPHLFRFEEL